MWPNNALGPSSILLRPTLSTTRKASPLLIMLAAALGGEA